MNARSPSRGFWSAGVVSAALALPLAALSLDVQAAPKFWRRPPKEADQSAAKAGTLASPAAAVIESSPKVRLNHMRSSWKKVLEEFAKSTRRSLVADVVPDSYFSRFDRRDHSPEEALRILNAALEEEGFKLLEKGNYLVLIELNSTRRDYKPAVVPLNEAEAESDDEPAESAEPPSAPPVRAGIAKRVNEAAKKTEFGAKARATAAKKPSRRSAIRTVSGEAENNPRTGAPVPADGLGEQSAEEPKLTVVKLKMRDAVSVSRIMFNAFKGTAELVYEAGPRGLDGFRVYRVELDKSGKPLPRVENAAPRFSVGIDEEHNQLVIEATPAETPSVLRLVKMLDKLPTEAQRTVRAVTTSKDAGQLAETLQPELDRLADAPRKAARREAFSRLERARRNADDEDLDADEDEDQPGLLQRGRAQEEMPEGEEDMEAPEGPESSLLGSLKGEVTVEAVPELGILIIRGNEKDVASVMAVIREIEKLSAGTAPEANLHFLEHVNSEALASLLTSVYERLSPSRRTAGQGQQQQNVLVIPITRPNAILIVASPVDIDSVVDLAKKLDQPSDPRTQYKVFRLKYAIPSQVVETVTAVYPAADGTGAQGQPQGQAATTGSSAGLSPRVRITPDLRTNSVIVLARPRDMAEVALLISELDTEESASVAQIEIFTLRYAVADELSTTLQLAFQSLLNPARINTQQQGGGGNQFQNFQQGGGGQGAQELREVKSQILRFIDREGGRERLLQSGILSDIRISSDTRTNSIVVAATEASMELIAQLIKQFDQPTAFNSEIKIFEMKNGDAQSTVTLLNNLFGSQRTGQQGQQGQQQAPGLIGAGADDPSSTLIPLRFSTDTRTNTVIATGGGDALRVVEAIVYRLDESDVRQRENKVYRLKNNSAIDVANAISQFLQTQRQVEQADPGLVSPFEQIEREVIVVPEPVSNSLLVSATPRYFEEILELIQEIDAPPKQVLIQTLMVEVLLDNADEWGVELGLQDSVLFNRSILSEIFFQDITTTFPQGTQNTTQNVLTATATPGYTFNNVALGNNFTPNGNPSRVGGQGLTSFDLGRVNGDLGYGGLVLAAGSESVSALLRAVASRRRLDVLSRPQIRTIDNQQANIQVGQEIPRVGDFNINQQTGNATPLVQQRLVGLILEVTPRITPDNVVIMEVVARKDALSTQTVPLFLNPNGSTVDSPIIDTTAALTTVSVKNGQTVIIGGIITKRDETVERKVPLLGDIPILGQAFRYDFKRAQRTELLVFLTPRVVTDDAEAEIIKDIEIQRLNFIEAEAEMIHGPLRGVPEETGFHGTNTPPPMSPLLERVPAPPAPSLQMQPMSAEQLDDPSTPTTLMPGEPQQIPPFPEEDLNIDLSRKRRPPQRDAAVQPSAFETAASEAGAPESVPEKKKKPRYMPQARQKRPFLPGPGAGKK